MEKKTIEEAAEEYLMNIHTKGYGNIVNAFIAGAEWYAKHQSEQMQDKIEEKWKKYRYQTNNEDAWMFKEWLITQFKKS